MRECVLCARQHPHPHPPAPEFVLPGAEDDQLAQVAASLITVLEQHKDHVAAMLGLATMFTMQSQEQKARNMLKRISRLPYTRAFFDEFEKAYLLMANVYVQKGKYDLARDLCRRCLKHNQCSFKAHETLGHILERELAYWDAARAYEQAWATANKASPSVGYRLAFNYLKAQRFLEAIDISAEVLRRFPEYTAIKTDIFEPAAKLLRA